MKLPVAGEVEVLFDQDEARLDRVYVVAVDPKEALWTCIRESDNQLVVLTFDENDYWAYIQTTVQWKLSQA